MEKLSAGYFKNLDELVEELTKLKSEGKEVYTEINGHKLYSSNITEDRAYKEIYGMTKGEFRKKEEFSLDLMGQLEEDTRIAKTLAKYRIEAGKNHIFPEKLDNWEILVNASVTDSYHGEEIVDSLKIMKELDDKESIDDIISKFKNENYKEKLRKLIRNIVLNFSKEGPEFYKATTEKELVEEEKEKIKEVEAQNKELSEKNKVVLKHK